MPENDNDPRYSIKAAVKATEEFFGFPLVFDKKPAFMENHEEILNSRATVQYGPADAARVPEAMLDPEKYKEEVLRDQEEVFSEQLPSYDTFKEIAPGAEPAQDVDSTDEG